MENDKIDLSPLDPSNDKQRWNALIESIVTKAIEARQRRPSFVYQLFKWARPACALSAALAVIVVLGSVLYIQSAQTELHPQVKPTALLAVWAVTNKHPSTQAIFELFRGPNENN